MDDAHLKAAVCYVSLNPVRAGLVGRAEDWRWSSVRAHFAGADDSLVCVHPVREPMPDLTELLTIDHGDAFQKLRRSESTGRPVGTDDFMLGLERVLQRPIARRSPGRKPAPSAEGQQLRLLSQRQLR